MPNIPVFVPIFLFCWFVILVRRLIQRRRLTLWGPIIWALLWAFALKVLIKISVGLFWVVILIIIIYLIATALKRPKPKKNS